MMNTMCYIVSKRGVNRALKQWLPWYFHEENVIVVSPEKQGFSGGPMDKICEARNWCVRDFLETECEWLVFFDDDMYPTSDTSDLLNSTALVSSCVYYGPRGYGHHHGNFSAGACRIHRSVFESMNQWFAYGPNICECLWFEKKCADIGIEAVKCGDMGHCIPCVVAPGPDGSLRFVPETMYPDIKESPGVHWQDIPVHDSIA